MAWIALDCSVFFLHYPGQTLYEGLINDEIKSIPFLPTELRTLTGHEKAFERPAGIGK